MNTLQSEKSDIKTAVNLFESKTSETLETNNKESPRFVHES